MKVLITGATGLVGARLRSALLGLGQEVIGIARHPPDDGGRWLAVDLARASTSDWQRCLPGVDAVVNCIGIFRETQHQRFDELHRRGPTRLFDACAASGVQRVVQVSALGADGAAQTAYHRSKRAADEHLLGLRLHAVVVQPSLVFAVDGASSATLLTWASLPLHPLPAGGRQPVQPIAVDDVVAALLALLLEPADEFQGRHIALVGPRALTLAEYLAALRSAMGLGKAPCITVPGPLMHAAARIGHVIGRWLPGLLLSTESWQMLQRGNVATWPTPAM